ncbi:hypothetical protein E0L93_02180 [Rubrobacter taiwanensis]|jgi:hypothetical protein|uniref:Uncharacterized protein n=1 Tax=Rubrobacter taiwanensis TaxID=185139 RepID=A0A4R1BSE4_9ACTN|nr:hypothetical protein [Rubrobacter taiwanensis]TCJ20216.1 hypothetical protein E0L93_02180 [Rubrobacter taiwanensis]
MTTLECTARRIGDLESRTEEYELTYSADGGSPKTVRVRYQAARAFEINESLDRGVEAAKAAISEVDPDLAGRVSEEALSQLTWRAMQSVKYEEGAPRTSALEL